MPPIEIFFHLHPVFTVEEAKNYLNRTGSIANLLHYHHKRGRILLVRRGLYYTVPPGTSPNNCPINAYLLASKLAKDSVLAYDTALSFHGYAHSARYLLHYLTKNRAKQPFAFRHSTYQAVSIPSALIKAKKSNCGVMMMERLGMKIAVTTLERTFVDILDRPQLTGSWEEIWKSFESIEYLDLDQVIEYALLLANTLTITKVGYFLDTHREELKVSDIHLEKLHHYALSHPRYLERFPKGPQKLISSWNLIVPRALHERQWEEPHGDF